MLLLLLLLLLPLRRLLQGMWQLQRLQGRLVWSVMCSRMVCQIVKAQKHQQQQQWPTEVAKGVGAAVMVLLLMLLPLVVGLAMWQHRRVTICSCALQQWSLRG
jgi:hypothetical protein